MRVVIAGGGSVGRSIARELNANGHQVLIIDKAADEARVARLPEARWLAGDACEISSLQEAGMADCDAVVAATGDDKVNLVRRATCPGSAPSYELDCQSCHAAGSKTLRRMRRLLRSAVSRRHSQGRAAPYPCPICEQSHILLSCPRKLRNLTESEDIWAAGF